MSFGTILGKIPYDSKNLLRKYKTSFRNCMLRKINIEFLVNDFLIIFCINILIFIYKIVF